MADSTPRKLILASTSPRRRELLREAGYAFEVAAPDVDEQGLPGEAPDACARRLAREKAQAVAGRLGPGVCVIAADTMVVLAGEVFGKPCDAADAQRMLLRLAGETHEVLTGFALICTDDGREYDGVTRSRVRMRSVSPSEARRYAESGEPLDKAGGYAAQGDAGRFIEAIDGLRSNVIGLPVEDIEPLLANLGVVPGA